MKYGDILDLDDLCGYLKLPKSTVYKLVQEGSIPGRKAGRQWRFHRGAVDGWLMRTREPETAYTTDNKPGLAIAAEMKEGLETIYGKRLKGVYLFGSYARGQATEDSDVDVLIVLDNVGRYSVEVNRTGVLASMVSLKYEVSVSRVFVSLDQWERATTVFYRNVREEAIAV